MNFLPLLLLILIRSVVILYMSPTLKSYNCLCVAQLMGFDLTTFVSITQNPTPAGE